VSKKPWFNWVFPQRIQEWSVLAIPNQDLLAMKKNAGKKIAELTLFLTNSDSSGLIMTN
jgi:hypothetical protein